MNKKIKNEINDIVKKVNDDPILKSMERRRREDSKKDSLNKAIDLLNGNIEMFFKEISQFRDEIGVFKKDVSVEFSEFKKDVGSELQDNREMLSKISLNTSNADKCFEEKVAFLKSEFDSMKKNHCSPQQFLILQKILKRAENGDKFWTDARKEFRKKIIEYMIVSLLTAIIIFGKNIIMWFTGLFHKIP